MAAKKLSVEELESLQRASLLGETSKIPWQELETFFARGMVVQVAPHLDLINVALEISRDNARLLEHLIDSGDITREFDEQAAAWSEDDAVVWCVVVKPWVLVQSVRDDRVLN